MIKAYYLPSKQAYDNTSRIFGLLGVGLAALTGIFCYVGGSLIYLYKSTISSGIILASLGKGTEKELLSLALNLVVTSCTEATGFVHGVALRAALVSEDRLHFNTNLRLLSAATGWFNPNGTLCNVVMAILLILSYCSNLLVTLVVLMLSSSNPYYAELDIYASEVPLIVLGVVLQLQALIAFTSYWVSRQQIVTWSSSPFDLTAALVHNVQIPRVPGRCMHNVCDQLSGPVTPSLKQPSAWRARRSIKIVVIILWALVVVCVVWGLVVAYLSDHNIAHTFQTWSFFPQAQSPLVVYSIKINSESGISLYSCWALYYTSMAAIQGPLTLSLHCSELIVNAIRDERVWRKATKKKGARMSPNAFTSVFSSSLNITLFVAKALLHWMFGLAISLNGLAKDDVLSNISIVMWPSQILNFAAALSIPALIFTIAVFYQPKGPQPAAYGHVRTLANLIDEFPSNKKLYWGDKGYNERGTRHAGTSGDRLPDIYVDAQYGFE